MINNSMAETGQRNSVFNIHLELGQYGYELTRGDIVRTFPLNIQANKETKVTTVVVYKNHETATRVTEAAKAAGIWGSRTVKVNDRTDDRTGYFRAPTNIRRKSTPRKNPLNKVAQTEEDQPGQTLPGTPQPTGDRPREVHTVEDDASSVEITEEIYNMKGNPVTVAPRTGDTDTPVPSGDELTPSEVGLVEEVEPDLGDGQDKTRREMGTHLKSPLELGLLPPFCTNDSPSDSGENQDQGEEPDEESGIESNVTDESPGVRSLPPRQERRPESNMNKVVTAAMKKGRPVSDLRDVLRAGIDPREMPMNPENAPHSLLRSRRNQSDEREEHT